MSIAVKTGLQTKRSLSNSEHEEEVFFGDCLLWQEGGNLRELAGVLLADVRLAEGCKALEDGVVA